MNKTNFARTMSASLLMALGFTSVAFAQNNPVQGHAAPAPSARQAMTEAAVAAGVTDAGNVDASKIDNLLMTFDPGSPVDALQRMLYFVYNYKQNQGANVVPASNICKFFETLDSSEPFKSNPRYKLFRYLNDDMIRNLLYQRPGSSEWGCGKGLIDKIVVHGGGDERELEFQLWGDLNFKNARTGVGYKVTDANETVCPGETARSWGRLVKKCRNFRIAVNNDRSAAQSTVSRFHDIRNETRTVRSIPASNRNDFRAVSAERRTQIESQLREIEAKIGPAIDARNDGEVMGLYNQHWRLKDELDNSHGDSIVSDVKNQGVNAIGQAMNIRAVDPNAQLVIEMEGNEVTLRSATLARQANGQGMAGVAVVKSWASSGDIQRAKGGSQSLD